MAAHQRDLEGGPCAATGSSLFGLQPHRHQYFKLSTDPFFIEKVRGIVGLYLAPPDHVVVLCVDERARSRLWQPAVNDLRRPRPDQTRTLLSIRRA